MLDCHVHVRDLESVDDLEGIRRRIGFERMNVVSVFYRQCINMNPASLVAKARYPDSFYVFLGLDHTTHFSGGAIKAPSLVEQIERAMAMGADGIKMLENKPTHRKLVDIPVDDPYFEEYFACLEQTGFPVVWHVADPEEFWDPATTPRWAAEKGWGYDETFVPKEQLYSEVENVLDRHPRLKVIFSHFFFMSADLPRLGRLLDRFPGMHIDLSPGIELLYNLSRDVESSRDFVMRYSDKILFGTDISSNQTPESAALRSWVVTHWLETDDEYRVPAGADYLLGPPEDGIIRGLALPEETLVRILRGNFERIAGLSPRKLEVPLAIEECERLAWELSALDGIGADSTEAARSAVALRRIMS